MRIAVISDIHGNLEALEAVERSIRAERAERVICLGDVVGYGASPNECVDRVRAIAQIVLLGNHDAAAVDASIAQHFTPLAKASAGWTAAALSPDRKTYLTTLSYFHTEGEALFVHATPLSPASWMYLMDDADARDAFPHFTQRICFIGHTHRPIIYGEAGPAEVIDSRRRYIVNVGSVGQPRDGSPDASYGIFDTMDGSYRNIRISYDVEVAAKKIREVGLPFQLAERLYFGT